MIRLIQRRLIIPRGDTGSFSIPVLSKGGTDNIAVFTIFDETTRTKMFQKIISGEGDVLTIAFTHSDTVNLKPGKYVWDIKYYKNPEYIDDELVNGEEIDSYYAGFSLPVCEIRETADNYLVSPEAPTATLSPEQLEIVTSAIHSLNEAIRKTQENVEHYPEIRDEVWYVWDAELGDYVSTDVSANGIVGNGIASAVLNNDYTLTLNFTDGTSFTSPSIRGQKGNGIDDIVLNNNFTLTISYTDGGSYTTPSIRGPIGPTPQFSIGTVQDGAVAAASVTGTAENPVLNLTLPNAHVPTRVSQLENDAGYLTQHQDLSGKADKVDTVLTTTLSRGRKENTDIGIASFAFGGNLEASGNYSHSEGNTTIASGLVSHAEGASTTASGEASHAEGKWNVASGNYSHAEGGGNTSNSKTVASGSSSHAEGRGTMAVGLNSHAEGGNTSSTGANSHAEGLGTIAASPGQHAQGKYNVIDTDSVYADIVGNGSSSSKANAYALDWDGNGHYAGDVYVGCNSDSTGGTKLPTDVQVNGVSVVTDGVANVPIGNNDNFGVYKTGNYGITVMNIQDYEGTLAIASAPSSEIKAGNGGFKPITPSNQYRAVFYGLAKASGDTTQKDSSNSVGTYTPEAKAAIQSMLDVPSNASVSSAIASAVGNVHEFGVEIAQTLPTENIKDHTIYFVPKTGDTNDVYDEYIRVNNAWEMIGNTQIDLSNYVQKTDYASNLAYGVVSTESNFGIRSVDGVLSIVYANTSDIKEATNYYKPIGPRRVKHAAFYGLAQAAGDTTQSQSDNSVGTYTDEAKAAIQQMLDVPNKAALDTKAPVIYKTVTSSSLTITDAIPNLPLKSLILTITGDPTDVGITSASVVVSPSTTAAEGTTYTKSFDAIYEGTLDFISGKLTITKAILDLGSIGYNYNNDYHYFFSQALYGIIDTNEPIYSSDLTVVTPEEIQAGTEGVAFGGATYIYVYNNNYVGMTIDEFKAAVAGKCIAYSLRTPRVVQLSAEDIRALSGTTYISSEDGNLNVEYLVDTKSYIDAGIENIDLSGFATKADTVLDTTLSRGRVTDSKIGENSFAFGNNVVAAGKNSCAQGIYTIAIGDRSRAEGYGDLLKSKLTGEANSTSYISTRLLPIGAVCYTLSNTNNYVRVIDSQDNDGIYTIVLSETLDAINPLDNKNVTFFFNVAFASNSHTEGANSIALSANQHVEGKNNVPLTGKLQIIGNGLSALSSGRSNAYALDEDGTGHYMGDVYVHANTDSTGGTKLATVNDIPEVPVQDVQVNGMSVLNDGVANVPKAGASLGVVRINSERGISISDGLIFTQAASTDKIKAETDRFAPIVPWKQHESTFYGLSKVAGVDLANETVTLGTYPETSKTAIKAMLGVQDGLKVVRLI